VFLWILSRSLDRFSKSSTTQPYAVVGTMLGIQLVLGSEKTQVNDV